MKDLSFKKAFTLAEVIVVLTLLGTVAAVTIPSTINRSSEKATVTKFLKNYAALTTAYDVAVAERGPLLSWFSPEMDREEKQLIFYETIKSYMHGIKDCSDGKGCVADTMMKSLDGTDYANYNDNTEPKFMLADGSIVWFLIGTSVKTPSANIKIDVNGTKPPNAWGRDTFLIVINPPEYQISTDIKNSSWKVSDCSLKVKDRQNGIACSNWIEKYHNMNYLHCDVSDDKPNCN